MENIDYDAFITQKTKRFESHGFEPLPLIAPAFDWQAHVIQWAVRKGRAALFEDCGLGKTLQQLEWASQVCRHSGGSVIVLTPLAVAHQTAKEASKFGLVATVAESQADVTSPGIWITNYEKLEHFDASAFVGVVLDESSILKNFTGKMRKMLTEKFSQTPYRLCCTATPSPNDYTEFGQHADFLGVCSPAQMLATFFLNDTFNTGDWRLKKHAESEFWAWLASWAACVSKPSDIGFSDDGYILPPLNMHSITVDVDWTEGANEGELFRAPTLSATTMHEEMRMTSQSRAEKVAELVNNSSESWIVWCNTNDESEKLAALIPDAVEICGHHSSSMKEMAADWFDGSLCICDKREFRYKLASWQTPNTSAITTNETKQSGSLTPSNISKITKKSGNCICENTTASGNLDGTKEPGSSKTRSIAKSEINTETIHRLGQSASSTHQDGQPQTLKNDVRNICENTDSLLIATTRCSKSREANAPSALLSQNDSTLTTATPQAKSEDYFVNPATLDSASSTTIQNHLSAQRCICGHQSGKRILISKGSIFGMGLNFQSCWNVAFIGLNYSFESFYQSLRRCYRFGQTHEVNAYIVNASTEGAIIKNVTEKINQHKEMQEKMKLAASAFQSQQKKLTMKTDITTAVGNGWQLHHGDCVRVIRQIDSESIDFSVFSPPFADLFTYSNDLQDMGNCSDMEEFMGHFGILIDELYRVMKEGRIVAVHCVDLLSTMSKHGKIEFQDFSGEIKNAFRARGFLFHCPITIWKSPVTEMQRTKAHGLLYKTLKSDSCKSRVGCADYLLAFRKPGENQEPVTKDPAKYPVDWWQEVASPVWMTVDQGRVLNKDGARDNNDERHICPLQLDVIERAVELWSNPGDLVYSPFTGIGSEGVGALTLDRRFIGSELKESYFNQARQNLANAKAQLTLF